MTSFFTQVRALAPAELKREVYVVPYCSHGHRRSVSLLAMLMHGCSHCGFSCNPAFKFLCALQWSADACYSESGPRQNLDCPDGGCTRCLTDRTTAPWIEVRDMFCELKNQLWTVDE